MRCTEHVRAVQIGKHLRWDGSLVGDSSVEGELVVRVKALNHFERVHRHKNFTNISVNLISVEAEFKFVKQGLLVEVLHIGCVYAPERRRMRAVGLRRREEEREGKRVG